MATRVGQGKIQLAAFDGPFPKTPHRCKKSRRYLLRKPSYTNFVPNFIAMATGVGRGMRLTAFDGPSPKTHYRLKNLAEISYASRVIANFVPNFVAMATGVGRGKMRLAAFDGPSPKPPKGAKIPQKSLTQAGYSQFCPKFCYHSNGGQSG